MIVGSLAIYEEDPTGTAAKLLGLAVPNAQQNCAQAVYSDGTWTETANYWYAKIMSELAQSKHADVYVQVFWCPRPCSNGFCTFHSNRKLATTFDD